MPLKVEGIDYSIEGIRALREEMIKFREASYNQWPEAIPFTVAMTHVIALMAYFIEVLEEQNALGS